MDLIQKLLKESTVVCVFQGRQWKLTDLDQHLKFLSKWFNEIIMLMKLILIYRYKKKIWMKHITSTKFLVFHPFCFLFNLFGLTWTHVQVHLPHTLWTWLCRWCCWPVPNNESSDCWTEQPILGESYLC